jgi:hypothetical protein
MFDLAVVVNGGQSSRRPSPLYKGAYLGEQRADDPTAVLGSNEVDGEKLEQCLDPIETPLGELKVPARFAVGPDGRTLAYEARWPAGFPAAVAGCMDQVLKGARFNCPLSGKARVLAIIDIAVKPYGPPVKAGPTPD